MKTYSLIILNLFSFLSLIAQPRAIINSDNTSICESGVVNITIQFEDIEPPIDFRWRIKSESMDQSMIVTNYLNTIYQASLHIEYSTTITLEKFYDANLNEYIPTENNSMVVTVDEMPHPNAGIDVENINGLSFQLQGIPESAQNTCYWSALNGGSFNDISNPSTLFTAENQGTYTLTFNEENGACIGSDEIKLSFADIASGLPEVNLRSKGELLAYPNPCANGKLYLQSKQQLKQIHIYSASGVLLISTSNINSPVNVSHLKSGTYILHYETIDYKHGTTSFIVN